MASQRPVTERRNPHCGRLDGALTPDAFLATLRSADAEVFTGFEDYRALLASRTCDAVAQAAAGAAKVVQAGGVVVLTGCGTSGRLAYLTAKRYAAFGNAIRYAMAGHDAALLLSDELPEDDPDLGAADVKAAAAGTTSPPYVVGVTCGLSAAYVAGQLTAAMDADTPACAVGFNPTELARGALIERCWPSGKAATFRDVAEALEARAAATPSKYAIVNPVVGPEPVGGSSRMKGGSATLVILDALCLKALAARISVHPDAPSHLKAVAQLPLPALLCEYQRVHTLTYMAAEARLPAVMQRAADAILRGGRVYYLGAGSAACVGFIDFSEMPDTYGAPFDQTRAFVAGGWAAVGNAEGDISSKSHLLRLSLDDFDREMLPQLRPEDAVCVLVGAASEADVARLASSVARCRAEHAGTSVALLSVSHSSAASPGFEVLRASVSQPELAVDVQLPMQHEGFSDLSMKLMINAVSTYAQAAGRGALFQGVMIACGPANDKIYARCVAMIAENVRVSEEAAEVALIRSIYDCDVAAAKAKLGEPRVNHIKAALLPEDRRHEAQVVLPVAFLLAIPNGAWSVAAARDAMTTERQLSRVLERALAAANGKESTAASASAAVLAIDLGGTNVRCGVVSAAGKLLGALSRAAIPSGDRSPGSVIATVVAAARAAAVAASSCVSIGAVAVAQPGHVNPDGSIDHLAAYPEWGDAHVPIAAALRDAFPAATVSVNDDAECALAGEVFFGAGRLAKTVAAITVGTGVGSGLSLRSGAEFHRGGRGLIELGHHIVDTSSDALVCPCGQRGCVEMYASGAAIARRAGVADAEAAFAAAEKGDAAAVNAIEAAATVLGVACINAARAYDPDVIVVCGDLGRRLLPQIRAAYRTRNWTIHDDAALVPLSAAQCAEPGVLGAAALAFRARGGSTTASAMTLRHTSLDDLDATYNVCLKTGDAGADGTHLFSDPKLLGSIYTGPYVTHSPSLAFALVDSDGAVCGYTLGVLDTIAFGTLCDDKWWPVLQQGPYAAERLGAFRPNEQTLIRKEILERKATAAAAADDAAVRELWTRYPSHLHIDLLAGAQGRGFGPVMMGRLLDAMRTAGSCGVHLTMAATNSRAFGFYEKLGFTKYREVGDEWILVKAL